MSQSRRHSLLEAWANTLSGFIISLIAGELIFPAMGLPVSHSQNLLIVLFFTVISIIRTYCWRRAFNHWHKLKVQQYLYDIEVTDSYGFKTITHAESYDKAIAIIADARQQNFLVNLKKR